MSQSVGENLYDEPVIKIMRIPPDMTLNPMAVSAEQLKGWAVQQLRGDLKRHSRWTEANPKEGLVMTSDKYSDWVKVGRKWYAVTTEQKRWMHRFGLTNKDLEG